MALVSIVTVNFNQPEATIALLNSVNLHYGLANIEIILVDNCSEKDHESDFKAIRNDLIYVRSDRNLGFAGGNNLGIMRAKGEFVFLVNNDTELTPGLIETLVATLQDKKVGMVSPKINYYDDKAVLQYAGFTPMNYFTCRNRCIGQFEQDKGQYDGLEEETGYIHGAAMMVRRDVLDRAGLMAENFFLYYEEMDWCEIVRRAGYQLWVNTKAVIYHKESLSVGKNSALKEYFMNRNRILFIRRNAHWYHKIFFYPYFLLFVTPRNILKYRSSGTPEFTSILLKAIRWNFSTPTNSTHLGFK